MVKMIQAGASSTMMKLWLALIGLAFFVSCSQAPKQKNIAGETMGTTYHVSFISGDPAHKADEIKANIDGLLEQINQQMSTYDPNSELSRINASRQTSPFVISRSLEVVVKRALEIAEQTGGVLDVTVGPLVNLWGFGPQARPEQIPTQAELDEVLDEIGFRHIQVDNHQLTKLNPELYIDLSTIAKGYAVDRVARVLEQLRIHNYLVEIGGEMRIKGSKEGGKPWRIAIEKPISTERAIQRIIEPIDMAVATSGDYRNYYEEDGVRYSHIIDPRTGKPIQHNLVSVTVLTETSMDADAYSTALMVLGPEAALEFAQRHDLAVMLVTREDQGFKEYTTPRFDTYVADEQPE